MACRNPAEDGTVRTLPYTVLGLVRADAAPPQSTTRTRPIRGTSATSPSRGPPLSPLSSCSASQRISGRSRSDGPRGTSPNARGVGRSRGTACSGSTRRLSTVIPRSRGRRRVAAASPMSVRPAGRHALASSPSPFRRSCMPSRASRHRFPPSSPAHLDSDPARHLPAIRLGLTCPSVSGTSPSSSSSRRSSSRRSCPSRSYAPTRTASASSRSRAYLPFSR